MIRGMPPPQGNAKGTFAIPLIAITQSETARSISTIQQQSSQPGATKSAYLREPAINPGDVRGCLNLAFVHTRQKNYRPALAVIADALALDKTGQYRERLLQKRGEVLQLVAVKHQAEYLRMVNLVSKAGATAREREAMKNEERTMKNEEC